MNLPNILTVIRMLMVPVFVYLFDHGQPVWALVVFLAASITDALDGYLARKHDLITRFGKLMDPLADKLMTVAMLLCLANAGRIQRWVPIVMIVKEGCMVVASAFLLKKKSIVTKANIFGKVATVCFVVAICVVYPWHRMSWLFSLGNILIYLSLSASVLAGVQYAVLYGRQAKDET